MSHHSFAADYWLKEGDRRERLYHLLHAGQVVETEMLIANHGAILCSEPDQDLFGMVMAIPAWTFRYAPKVREVQGRVARAALEYNIALTLAEEQMASTDAGERLRGIKLKGGVLANRNEFELSYLALVQGRGAQDRIDVELECAIAEVLMAQGKADQAKALILPLLNNTSCSSDLQDLERLYFEMGRACQGSQEPHEAIKYYSKAVGLARPGDKRRIYEAMSLAYLSIGMREKGTEYALKAGIKRQDWSAACPGP